MMKSRWIPRVVFGVAILATFVPSSVLAIDVSDTRLLSEPALSDDHVVFAYAGDLWIVDRDQTQARRLTSHEGREASPRISPDGSLVAFSAEYDGNMDVFVVPISGGAPQRLTWHPGRDLVEGFTPDGSAVLFSSQRHVFTNRYTQLFEVPTTGGFPRQLPIPNGLRASYSPDGRKIAYIPIPERFQQWKNYRGGTTSRIWIYNVDDHEVEEIPQPEGRCNDTDPVWIGNRVFFRSDREGELNVFSYEPGSSAPEQHTAHDDFPVLSMTSSASELVYEQAGYLHTLAPGSSPERLRIGVAADLADTRPRWAEGPRFIRTAGISPTGARAVFEYRGDIITLPAKKGDERNLTATPGAHERGPSWSPDGAWIAYFSDASGEYLLHVVPQDGRGQTRTFDPQGAGFYEELDWSPDSKKVSYVDNSWSLYVLDIDSGDVTKVVSQKHYGPTPFRGLEHSWSPDSRWLAYTASTDSYFQQVFVFDTRDGTSTAITDGLSEASEPVFDTSGDYLYFAASTDAGPVKHWFAMSNNDMEVTSSLYLAVLDAESDSPFAPESDEEAVESKDDEGADESAEEEAGDDAEPEDEEDGTKIDFEGIDQRILALPVPAGAYNNLQTAGEGQLLYVRRNDVGTQLYRFDLGEREETSMLAGANGFAVSSDGKKLIYVASGKWGIASTAGKINASDAALDVSKLQTRIDPMEEWKQIFHEVWRINRDYFYDPQMHGADWPAMREKYEQFLPHLATRRDLNRLLQWMCSELAVGHHSVGGGDFRSRADSVPGGLLGAEFEIDQGRYRLSRVFGGLNWNPQLRSPLTEPGVNARVGEYLIAVEGRNLTADENVYSRFENTAGKAVRITLSDAPNGGEEREVVVTPIEHEGALRNREWVESNLEKVTEATDGRVAYVYVPNTTGLGHVYFKRYFFPQVHKDAIIVDERFNGGGQVADYYIDHLRRPYISHWATRYGEDLVTPSAAIQGPKVMLIDETAGSGGDLLPWMFDKLELGTLIGKRTWGGLVGVLGFPILLDGGFVTAPNLAIWTEDGFVVENVGVPPHIEVEQWPKDVIAGRDPQLEKAIEVALEQLEANPPQTPRKPPYPTRAVRD